MALAKGMCWAAYLLIPASMHTSLREPHTHIRALIPSVWLLTFLVFLSGQKEYVFIPTTSFYCRETRVGLTFLLAPQREAALWKRNWILSAYATARPKTIFRYLSKSWKEVCANSNASQSLIIHGYMWAWCDGLFTKLLLSNVSSWWATPWLKSCSQYSTFNTH